MRFSTLSIILLIHVTLAQFVKSDKKLRNFEQNDSSSMSNKKYATYNENRDIKSKNQKDHIGQEFSPDHNDQISSKIKEKTKCRGKKCQINTFEENEHDSEERHVKYGKNNQRENGNNIQNIKNKVNLKKNNVKMSLLESGSNNNYDSDKKSKGKSKTDTETNGARVIEREPARKPRKSEKLEDDNDDSDEDDNNDSYTGDDSDNSNTDSSENDVPDNDDDDDAHNDEDSSKKNKNDVIYQKYVDDNSDESDEEDSSKENNKKANHDKNYEDADLNEISKKDTNSGKNMKSKKDAIIKEKVCQKKKGKYREDCDSGSADDSSEESDETGEEMFVSKKKMKYSIKFAHEKEKNRKKKEHIDNSIMRIHKSGRKKEKFLDDDDSSEEEDDHFPKKLRLFDDDDEY